MSATDEKEPEGEAEEREGEDESEKGSKAGSKKETKEKKGSKSGSGSESASETEEQEEIQLQQIKRKYLFNDRQWKIIVAVIGSGLTMVLVFITLNVISQILS
jgi:hypothetical protein